MTGGLVGEVPEWYPLVRAARYLNTPPWELAEVEAGPWWMLVALAAEDAETQAQKEHQSGR